MSVFVCAYVFDRTTQVFSPRPPRYHQSLSSSFIKHCRCTWAYVACWCPLLPMSTYLFLLLFYLLFLWGLSERNSREAREDANLYILEKHADVVNRERKRKGYKKKKENCKRYFYYSLSAVSTVLTMKLKKSPPKTKLTSMIPVVLWYFILI